MTFKEVLTQVIEWLQLTRLASETGQPMCDIHAVACKGLYGDDVGNGGPVKTGAGAAPVQSSAS